MSENKVILNIEYYNRLKSIESKKIAILEKEKEELLEKNDILEKSFRYENNFFGWYTYYTKDESQLQLMQEVEQVNKTNLAIEKENAKLEKTNKTLLFILAIYIVIFWLGLSIFIINYFFNQ